MKKITLFILLACFVMHHPTVAQLHYANNEIATGADQINKYRKLIKNKRVAILANRTTVIGDVHLVDSLLALGVTIKKVFGPEHGFRGNASNGTEVGDEIDPETGISIISLYGAKRKPTAADLADIDIVIFDIQDVGCRFYTNINALRDLMEACAEHNKELLILDRPNPNAYFVDGPILNMDYKSGIGQFPIPIVHGMTTGEFALMINGQGWLPNKLKTKLKIIKVANYKHDMLYKLPVSPSPNLNTEASILLYPSTCLFEGVALNHGRGTDYAFTMIGGPMLEGKYTFSYVPISKKGMSESPLYMDQRCWGIDLRNYDQQTLVAAKKINLSWMIELYAAYPQKDKFFDRSISKQIGNIDFLAGDPLFKKQIQDQVSEEEIRKSWEPGLLKYKQMRKKYLLYP